MILNEDYKKTIIRSYMDKVNKQQFDLNDIIEMINSCEDLRVAIHRQQELQFEKQDIESEIEYINYERKQNNEEQIVVDDETKEEILDRYDDHRAESEEWHLILEDVLKDFDIKE